MKKDFFVCSPSGLKELLSRGNDEHSNPPQFYLAGYTEFARWVYNDYSPDCDCSEKQFHVVDYSDDGENTVWDKFFDYKAAEIFNEQCFEKLTVDRVEYHIDVFCNEFEYYILEDFWHSSALNGDELEWLNDKND